MHHFFAWQSLTLHISSYVLKPECSNVLYYYYYSPLLFSPTTMFAAVAAFYCQLSPLLSPLFCR
jgi:hypothetical protein